MKKVFVTGANGLIGQVVVEKLLRDGYAVAAFVRKPNTWFASHSHLQVYIGDINNQKSLIRAMKGCDVVVHLAAAKSDQAWSYATNVQGTKNVLAVARRCDVKFFVQVSTLSTKIFYKGVYASTKAEADDAVRKSSLATVILKPSIVYGDQSEGVFGSLVKFARLPIIPMIGDGKQMVWPIHVEDVAAAIAAAISHPTTCRGKTFDLGGPTKVSLQSFIRLIEKKVLKKKRFNPIFHVPIKIGVLLAHLLKKISAHPPITLSNIYGSTQEIPTNPKPFFQATGFQPRSLQSGLRFDPLQNKQKEVLRLWKYVTQEFHCTQPPTKPDIQQILQTFQKNHIQEVLPSFLFFPFFLSVADLLTKIFFPDSRLQKKLFIVAAFFETSPISASALLPQSKNVPSILRDFFFIGIRTCTTIGAGIFLLFYFLLFPSYVEKI
jgi:NADH dehydrogenase